MNNKIRYPKCPYCGEEYTERIGGDYVLLNLATYGWVNEANVTCRNCGEKFRVTAKLSGR